MESILTKGVDNNFFFYNNKFINRQLDFEMYSFIDNWRQTENKTRKSMRVFLFLPCVVFILFYYG